MRKYRPISGSKGVNSPKSRVALFSMDTKHKLRKITRIQLLNPGVCTSALIISWSFLACDLKKNNEMSKLMKEQSPILTNYQFSTFQQSPTTKEFIF